MLTMHLRIVLRTLSEHQLYAKFSKCDVWRWEVKFLGYVVTLEGISIDLSKVEAVLNFECQTLEDLWDLQGTIDVSLKISRP